MPAILAGEPRARLIFAGDDRFGENPGLAEMLKKLAAEIGVSENVVFAGATDTRGPPKAPVGVEDTEKAVVLSAGKRGHVGSGRDRIVRGTGLSGYADAA